MDPSELTKSSESQVTDHNNHASTNLSLSSNFSDQGRSAATSHPSISFSGSSVLKNAAAASNISNPLDLFNTTVPPHTTPSEGFSGLQGQQGILNFVNPFLDIHAHRAPPKHALHWKVAEIDRRNASPSPSVLSTSQDPPLEIQTAPIPFPYPQAQVAPIQSPFTEAKPSSFSMANTARLKLTKPTGCIERDAAPFQPSRSRDPYSRVEDVFQNICFQPDYLCHSSEELKFDILEADTKLIATSPPTIALPRAQFGPSKNEEVLLDREYTESEVEQLLDNHPLFIQAVARRIKRASGMAGSF
ncbi:hypothetical protein GLAREA_08990 [Glarea lozoyensis ATCC 20868]|uniref:Uncharacterized protein n=1 Tax=Glarea lozoyensis (strain ATCC 20868 / MF5171) TaxID=1116229 RepID=S3DEK9_GLAL2|nr:uncharacterized protein GLAREA_08990 [Glarea lozoyensis ATCC 20868]EPE36827.1 hypothetical protein GLAREA_08990 [Glarea lozoyensis ATCC 20868]